MPPLPEIPEPIRGRQLVMIDGAVQGDDAEAIIAPLRALGAGDRHVRDRPARRRSCACTRTPRSRCPYTSESALIDELPARGASRRSSSSPAPARARRC